MKPANTTPATAKPIKQKYLDVYMSPNCEFLRTPEQHQYSVLNLVQNDGAPYVWLPESYFSTSLKSETKIASYWKSMIYTVLRSPKRLLKKYTGWKQQKECLNRLLGGAEL